MSLWSSAEAAKATGGRTTCDWAANGVSIDTRTLQPGDLFVALKDVRDGHDFVAQAFEAGAAAALVSRVPDGVTEDAPLLIVKDVLPALEALGRAARARTRAKVVAVTGSVGKTSTKEMLRTILERQGKTHAAEASYNNHWGVPLTLARMPVDADFAVIEIGMNHPGEIAPLARMARPDVAMITTVAPAHMEAFESIEGIAHEKAAIFDGLEQGGVAIINADIATTDILQAKARDVGAKPVLFATGKGNFTLNDVRLSDDTTVCQCAADGEAFLFKLSSPGRHFAMNGLGALAAVKALGADLAVAAVDIAAWSPPAGRGSRERIILDDQTDAELALIDDAFNANPTSMAVSLEVLAAATPGDARAGRRIAVLGDMLELGESEIADHVGIGDLKWISDIHKIHLVGLRMKHLYEVLPPESRGEWRETAAEMAKLARQLAHAGDVVLVKGSKGSKVSLVVDAIRKMGHPPSEEQKDV